MVEKNKQLDKPLDMQMQLNHETEEGKDAEQGKVSMVTCWIKKYKL